MRILLTNDDGVHARGLHCLYDQLKADHDLVVVAPDRERSAVGHGITLNHPLRWTRVPHNGAEFNAITGLPADCVKFALKVILDDPPDLVLSGINRGSNTGINTIYSGTVAAAVEGMIAGIPSVALSLCSFEQENYHLAAGFAQRLTQWLQTEKMPRWSMLNVNVPPVSDDELKGVRVTRMGKARFEEFFIRRVDTRGRDYFWMDGEPLDTRSEVASDENAVREGYISITPLKFDFTDEEMIRSLNEWNWQKTS